MTTHARSLRLTVAGLCAAFLAGAVSMPAPAEAAPMLYLVEGTATDAGAPTGPAQAVQLLETMVIPSLDALAKDKRVLAGGTRAGARAGVFIVQVESHDELTAMVRALPFWGILEWKVTALNSFSARVTLEKKVLEQLKAVKR